MNYIVNSANANPNSRYNVIRDLLSIHQETQPRRAFFSTYIKFCYIVANIPLSILASVRNLGYKIEFKNHGEAPLINNVTGNVNFEQKKIVVDSAYMHNVLHEIGHIVDFYLYDVFNNDANYFNWLSLEQIKEFRLFFDRSDNDPYINRNEYAAEAFMAYFGESTHKDLSKIITKENLEKTTKSYIEKNIKFIEKHYNRRNPKTTFHFYFNQLMNILNPVLAGTDYEESRYLR